MNGGLSLNEDMGEAIYVCVDPGHSDRDDRDLHSERMVG